MLDMEKYWIEIKYLVYLECIKVCLYWKVQFFDNIYKVLFINIFIIIKKVMLLY